MRPQNEFPIFTLLCDVLTPLCSPGIAAARLQQEHGVRSLDETDQVVANLGYEISHVDLPEQVSGFAGIIGNKPHIVLNRAHSPGILDYTLAHELGHCVLHLDAALEKTNSEFSEILPREIEADLFAVNWTLFVGNKAQRDRLLEENPHSSAAIVMWLVLMVAAVVGVLIFGVCAKLSPKPLPLPEPI